MRSNSKWKAVASVFIVFSLAVTQLELTAFANDAVAQTTSQNQTTAAETRTNSPAPAPHKGRARKLIVIFAAVGAGVAAVFVVRSSKQQQPGIVVGAPSIGQPQ